MVCWFSVFCCCRHISRTWNIVCKPKWTSCFLVICLAHQIITSGLGCWGGVAGGSAYPIGRESLTIFISLYEPCWNLLRPPNKIWVVCMFYTIISTLMQRNVTSWNQQNFVFRNVLIQRCNGTCSYRIVFGQCISCLQQLKWCRSCFRDCVFLSLFSEQMNVNFSIHFGMIVFNIVCLFIEKNA